METRDKIKTTLNQHFLDIMSDPRQNRHEYIEKITQLIPPLVTNEKNEVLTKSITLNEVEEAVFQITEENAPNLDGFIVNFFHRFREMVKMDVWRRVGDSRVYKRI